MIATVEICKMMKGRTPTHDRCHIMCRAQCLEMKPQMHTSYPVQSELIGKMQAVYSQNVVVHPGS
eukprot:3823426-Amphidinium_carterae.1